MLYCYVFDDDEFKNQLISITKSLPSPLMPAIFNFSHFGSHNRSPQSIEKCRLKIQPSHHA